MRWPKCAIGSGPSWDHPRNRNRGLCAGAHHGCRNVSIPAHLRGAAGLSTAANSCLVMFVWSCLRKCQTRLMSPSFMHILPIFMLSRKNVARDWERNCWRERCCGAAVKAQTQSFCGRVLKVDRFIAGAAWLSLQIFSSCDARRRFSCVALW